MKCVPRDTINNHLFHAHADGWKNASLYTDKKRTCSTRTRTVGNGLENVPIGTHLFHAHADGHLMDAQTPHGCDLFHAHADSRIRQKRHLKKSEKNTRIYNSQRRGIRQIRHLKKEKNAQLFTPSCWARNFHRN